MTGVSQTYTPEEKRTASASPASSASGRSLIETDELACADFAANPADRCYHCKSELFGRIAELARSLGIDVVYDASNVDDLADYRPGRRATEERGVVSPLVLAGFTKKDVRALSKKLGLASWDKPANPCLASRSRTARRSPQETLDRIGAGEKYIRGPGIPRRQAPPPRRLGPRSRSGRRLRPAPRSPPRPGRSRLSSGPG